jgi:hypothetical protein
MITKTCKRCDLELPADTGFYANDGTCKECRKARVRANRSEKIDYYRAYDNSRANRADRVKARYEYSKTEAGIDAGNRAKHKWSDFNKKKVWVTNCVNNSIRDGKISKPCSCSYCGKTGCRIEGHHNDYDRPLEVLWLCSSCHREWHKINGEGKNPA